MRRASTGRHSCRRAISPRRTRAARWVAFGSGEERVYLDTPRWRDIRPATVWSALTGGKRVMHVEWVSNPHYLDRAVRLRPEEYRRLWAAIRADFELDERGGRAGSIIPATADPTPSTGRRASSTRSRRATPGRPSRLRLAGVKNEPLAALRAGLRLALPQGQRRLTAQSSASFRSSFPSSSSSWFRSWSRSSPARRGRPSSR